MNKYSKRANSFTRAVCLILAIFMVLGAFMSMFMYLM